MRWDIIHIQINKTGSTSIREALGISRYQPRHKTAEELMKLVGSTIWYSAYKFAFVRSPYERVVSSYEYKKRMGYDNIHRLNASFDQWVIQCFKDKGGELYGDPRYYAPCANWIYGHDGSLLVDDVYRFERFESEIEVLRKEMKARWIPGSDFVLPHRKKSKKREPLESYYRNPATLDTITRHFERDFELFGYESIFEIA